MSVMHCTDAGGMFTYVARVRSLDIYTDVGGMISSEASACSLTFLLSVLGNILAEIKISFTERPSRTP